MKAKAETEQAKFGKEGATPPRPTLNQALAPPTHPSEPAKILQKILLSHFITEPERAPNQYNRMKSPNKSTEVVSTSHRQTLWWCCRGFALHPSCPSTRARLPESEGAGHGSSHHAWTRSWMVGANGRTTQKHRPTTAVCSCSWGQQR